MLSIICLFVYTGPVYQTFHTYIFIIFSQHSRKPICLPSSPSLGPRTPPGAPDPAWGPGPRTPPGVPGGGPGPRLSMYCAVVDSLCLKAHAWTHQPGDSGHLQQPDHL